MHVLFIVPRFHPNLFYATKALVRQGHRVDMFTTLLAPLEDYSFVTPNALAGDDLTWRGIWHRLGTANPDLIVLRHTDGRWKRFLFVALLRGIRIVGYDLRPADFTRHIFSRFASFLRGKPWRRITPVPAPRGGYAQPHFIPFPVELQAGAATRTYMADGILRLICIAKLSQQRKRHGDLIEAIRALPADVRVELTIVGTSTVGLVRGATADYQDWLLAQAGTQGNVTIRILSDLDHSAVNDLYAQNDICVLPAAQEPLGVAPVEAMAAGTVPVVTDGCGCAGYITHGVDGFVYPVGDVAQLTAILRHLGDPATLATVGRATARTAQTELSPVKYVQRMAALA